jgi:dihydropyrimidine dehydrogenase (NADP+)
VQVCTGVMLQGYAMIEELNQGLSDFLDKHGFKSLRDAVGHSLQYLTSHSNLVKMKMDRKIDALGTNRDEKWGNDITKETDNLASN